MIITRGRKLVNLDRQFVALYNIAMKIYRVLGNDEFEHFCLTNSLKSPTKSNWLRPERLVDPLRANDQYGKFFFFNIEDAVFFCYAFGGKGRGARSNIIELEVSEGEALSCLACGTYTYKSEQNIKVSYFPELYLPCEFVDGKIANGEFRIVDYKERRGINPESVFERQREKGYVALGRAIEDLAEKREALSQKIESLTLLRQQELYGSQDNLLPLPKEEKQNIMARLVQEKEDILRAEETAKNAFFGYAREHEKYMALAIISKEEQ